MDHQHMQPVLVVGFGKSGKAVFSFCKKNGREVKVFDDNPTEGAMEREECLRLLNETEEKYLVVTSPGVPLDHPVLVSARAKEMEVVSEIEFALRLAKDRSLRIIAITGTNGKTTVVELLTHVLIHGGKNAEAVGNIGRPLVDVLLNESGKSPDWYVTELSSFQLETTYTPLFQIGAILNITPNHLDWHPSMDAYRRAKERILSLIREKGLAVVNDSVPLEDAKYKNQLIRYGFSENAAVSTDGKKILFYGRNSGNVPEALLGKKNHDVENFLAVWTIATAIGVAPEVVEDGFRTFKKSRHRIEFVKEVKGVSYWDDSKGTNIAAVEAAVKVVPGPIVLIAGGLHKGASYVPWKEGFEGKVKAIFAMGQAKDKIREDLQDAMPVHLVTTLEEAVLEASRYLQPPFSVLLSPGCSSYDMFKDYKERGDTFQALVRLLQKKG